MKCGIDVPVLKNGLAMQQKVQNEITLCWGTPVFVLQPTAASSVNAELRRIILQRYSSDPGIQKSNFGGWHSTEDLLEWPYSATQALRTWIIDGFKLATKKTSRGASYNGRMQVNCWANVNGNGHSNDLHNHPQCAWSGVYYVDVGTPVSDEERSGFLHFLDPRAGAGIVEDPFAKFGKGREFKPINGQLLLFPSWLMHGVRPYRGQGERISIAFNIALLDLM